MPHISDRVKLINELEYALMLLAADGKECTSDFQEILDIRYRLEQTRCLNKIHRIPKSEGLERLMLTFPDRTFRIIARCSKNSFARLVSELENHPIFSMECRHKQKPVWLQVLITLNRVGTDGNASSIDHNVPLL